MSWSVSGTIADASDAALAPLRKQALTQQPDAGTQFAAAVAALRAILASATIGHVEDHEFTVTLAGHVNPHHKPREGWANDGVSVSVYQAYQP